MKFLTLLFFIMVVGCSTSGIKSVNNINELKVGTKIAGVYPHFHGCYMNLQNIKTILEVKFNDGSVATTAYKEFGVPGVVCGTIQCEGYDELFPYACFDSTVFGIRD